MARLLIPLLLASIALGQEPLPMPRVSGFTVFDTWTDEAVGPLEEGGTVYWKDSVGTSTNRSIIVAVEGVATSVDVRVDNVTAESVGRTHTDRSEPWTLCGDYLYESGELNIFGCPALAFEGEGTLTATPWDGNRKGTGLTISFTSVIERPPAKKRRRRRSSDSTGLARDRICEVIPYNDSAGSPYKGSGNHGPAVEIPCPPDGYFIEDIHCGGDGHCVKFVPSLDAGKDSHYVIKHGNP